MADRLGRVECSNLDLLARLAQRPLTIYNPPRMRGNEGREALSEWRDGRKVMRTDYLVYAPPEAADELRALVEGRRKKGPRTRTAGLSPVPMAAE